MSKRRHKKKPSAIRHGELATKERQRQNSGVISEVVDRDYSGKIYIKRHKSNSDCVLDGYKWLGKISATEHQAGMKFRCAYLRAVLRVNVDDRGSGCQGDYEMSAIIVPFSEQLLRDAYAVLSPAQKAVVLTVCGHDDVVGDTYRFDTFHRALEVLIKLWRIA